MAKNTLSEEEVEHFFALWFRLLTYVNNVFRVDNELKNLVLMENCEQTKRYPIIDKLWENDEILEQFMKENPYHLSQDDLSIIEGWKKHVTGDFVLCEHKEEYSVVFGNENHLYAFVGLWTPLDKFSKKSTPPCLFQSTLIPFKGKIIYVSVLNVYPSSFKFWYRPFLKLAYYFLKKKIRLETILI
ncbi:MAG TPA: hypothetical protein H9829_09770 [Candidatus Tetragenococcus pullicola]|nr:hypothetical protein [Candidatus Tetragenococcus pullicola]